MSTHGSLVRIHDLHTRRESWVRILAHVMMMAGRASTLNSLLSSNKVSLLTGEQTLRPHKGNNNVEYKWKQKAVISLIIYGI